MQNSVALTNDQIFAKAPSVFATTKHQSRSERFAEIPTISIVENLRREGFEVVQASQSRTRDESRRDFTKHLLRFRHVSDLATPATVRGTVTDIVLRNANDGAASYELLSGLFRFVCSNGMIVADSIFDSIKIRHTGPVANVASKVIEGTYSVLEQTDRVKDKVEQWGNINLTRDEQFALATAAHGVRFGDKDGNIDTPIRPEQLLTRRRSADAAPDLWSTYNVIQENVIRGGLSAVNQRTNRISTSRSVRGIDQDVKLNKALWQIADFFATNKLAA